MVSKIIEAISRNLKKEFNLKIYIDQVPQNFKENSFFVRVIDYNEKRLMDWRFQADLTINITYFNNSKIPNSQNVYDVMQKLNSITDFITLENGDILQGRNKKSEIVDSDLHYLTDFNFILHKEHEREITMGDLTYTGGIKNGES